MSQPFDSYPQQPHGAPIEPPPGYYQPPYPTSGGGFPPAAPVYQPEGKSPASRPPAVLLVALVGLVALFLLTAVVAVVQYNKASDYKQQLGTTQSQLATAQQQVDAARKAADDQKVAFDKAGLTEYYSKFELALKEVTRTGNIIDANPNASSDSPVWTNYNTAVRACRASLATYNKAARPFSPSMFEGTSPALPPLIDLSDTRTNCLDDAGES